MRNNNKKEATVFQKFPAASNEQQTETEILTRPTAGQCDCGTSE